jgi:hypothetical protein
MPRRYSATMPFRRFEPGTPRPTQGQLQAARELLERELLETEDADAERADAVTETELVVTDAARATTQQPVPSASRTKLSESQVLRADTLENTAVISCLNSVRDPSTTTVKDAGGRAAPSASLLALKNREIAMPSVFSSVDFYSEFGSSATEVALPTPQPTTLGDLPTAVLARIVGLAAGADVLFTLARVSHGFEDAVLEHVDMVYAAEDRARKGDFDWPADSSDSDSSTEEIDTATPRPRSLKPAAMALGAVTLACIAMWFSAARLILVKLGEALSGATIALPAGILTVLIVLLLSARAGAVGLPYDRAAIARHGRTFDYIERCTPLVERAYDTADGPASVGIYRMCWDSGCTCYCIPSEDRWMLDHVTDSQPNIGVEVASDAVLVVEAVGLINSTHPPKLVCDSFKIENGVKIATVSAPTMSRVLVTRGLKRTTRLGGVRPARLLDGTFAYFNDDNTAGIADCVSGSPMAHTPSSTALGMKSSSGSQRC